MYPFAVLYFSTSSSHSHLLVSILHLRVSLTVCVVFSHSWISCCIEYKPILRSISVSLNIKTLAWICNLFNENNKMWPFMVDTRTTYYQNISIIRVKKLVKIQIHYITSSKRRIRTHLWEGWTVIGGAMLPNMLLDRFSVRKCFATGIAHIYVPGQ